MTDKELRKLSRAEFLELLLEQTKEVERLQKLCDRALAQLENRRLVMDEAGSIAHAALQLNGVFESAQKAADQYLFNIQNMMDEQQKRCDQRLAETERQCEEMTKKAQADAQAYWNVVYGTLAEMAAQKPELKKFLSAYIPLDFM